MKLLIVSIFIFQSLWAQTPQQKTYLKAEEIIYNPGPMRPGRFVISYRDYEDIRLDVDLDGKIDYWFVRKGPLEISISYDQDIIKNYSIKKILGASVREIVYRQGSPGTLSLTSAQTRPLRIMGYSESEKCKSESPGTKNLLELPKITMGAVARIVESELIDESCFDHYEDISTDLSNTIAQAVAESGDNLSACLRGEKFESGIKDLNKDAKAEMAAIRERYILQQRKLLTAGETKSPILVCEEAKDDGRIATSEEGLIRLSLPKDEKKQTAFFTREKFEHELLHRAGAVDEAQVHGILALCQTSSRTQIVEGKNNGKGFRLKSESLKNGVNESGVKKIAAVDPATVSPSSSPTQATEQRVSGAEVRGVASVKNESSVPATGSAAAAATSTAQIPKELTVAQTNTPPATTLSQSITSPATNNDAGAQQALVQSASESRGVLSTANNLIGAMSTRAEAASLSSNQDSSSRSRDRETASAQNGKVATEKTSTRNTAAELLRSASRNSLRAGEQVVEEITIEGTKVATMSPAQTQTGPRSDTQNTSSSDIASARPSGGMANGTTDVGAATPAVSAGAGGTVGGVSAPKRSVGGATAAGDRSPASVSPAPPQAAVGNNTDNARTEVVSMISTGNYSQTKSRLKDPGFTKQLQEQKITIVDLYGNSYGANKGDVIFLDQGDRFVRQK